MAGVKKRGRQRRDAAKPASVAFLKTATHPAVRSVLAAATPIATFWGTVGTLTLAERRLIVEQALVLIAENYVHLPLKRTMHATDPAQALRLLRYRLDSATTATMGSEIAFHSEMLRIFASVRDLHTNYLLPAPFVDKIAFLPFDVEAYYANGVRRYQVSHLVQGFTHPNFEAGVEITAWSGVPIERAVEISADRNAGSNPPARHARGLQFLALRPLVRSLPPDEEWVEVDYIDLGGTKRKLRFDWMVFSPDAQPVAGGPSGRVASAALGIDLEMEMATRAKRVLFAPEAVAALRRRPRLTTRAAAGDSDVPTAMPNAFRARSVTTLQGPVGHLRIFTFSVNDPQAFVAEAERLIGLLPQTMLVLDVRGNGGGHIYASEGLLQLFTPRPITPEPTQFIVSPLNRRICHRHRANPLGVDLGPWLPSIDQANFTSAVYSTGYPITPVDFANARGQRYRGRVLCITDARCYSATDIFAAGFQDHQVGLVLGVDGNTGAGGANVWTHGLLKELLDRPSPPDTASPYRTLPKGAGMRVSIRRTLRVHGRAGSPLEDLGVEPDRQWRLTRNDLLNSNVDLLEHAATLLAGQPLRVLEAQAGAPSDGMVPISVTTANLSRLDIYVDGRPFGSRNVTAGTVTLGVPDSAKGARIDGFSGSMLVASNRLEF